MKFVNNKVYNIDKILSLQIYLLFIYMINKKSIWGSQLLLEIYERFECILFLSTDKYKMIFAVASAKVD